MSGSWNGRMLENPQHSDHDDCRRSAVERFEVDFGVLLHQVPSAPIVALRRVREVLSDLDLSYHKLLYRWLEIPFAVASEARTRPDLIAEIHELMPKRVKRYDPKDILRHTLQIAGNAFDICATPYSIACARERALKPFFDQGVDPRDLPRLIEEAGGLGILDDDQREQAKGNEARELAGMREVGQSEEGHDPGGAGASTTAKRSLSGDHVGELPDEKGVRNSDDDSPSSRRGEKLKGHGRRGFNRATDLAVTMTEELLQKVLSLPPGTTFSIQGVVEEPAGAWKKHRAERVDVVPRASLSSVNGVVDVSSSRPLH